MISSRDAPAAIGRIRAMRSASDNRRTSSRSSSAMAFAHRAHGADAELTRAGGPVARIATPDEDCARARVDGDVEAIFRTIVNDDVEGQRRRDLAARSVNHEYRRLNEPVLREPTMTL